MKRVILTLITAVVMLSILTTSAMADEADYIERTYPNVTQWHSDYYAYESSKPIHDFANVLATSQIPLLYLGTTSVGKYDSSEFCIYTYRKQEDYIDTYYELRERRVSYVALFIEVDKNGDYVDSYIRIRVGVCTGLPDEETLNDYFLTALPYIESGEYAKGSNMFFESVVAYVSDYNTKIVKEIRAEQTSQKVAHASKTFVLLLPVTIPFVIALICAWLHVKRLKKQLDTIHVSVDNTEYIANGTRLTSD